MLLYVIYHIYTFSHWKRTCLFYRFTLMELTWLKFNNMYISRKHLISLNRRKRTALSACISVQYRTNWKPFKDFQTFDSIWTTQFSHLIRLLWFPFSTTSVFWPILQYNNRCGWRRCAKKWAIYIFDRNPILYHIAMTVNYL